MGKKREIFPAPHAGNGNKDSLFPILLIFSFILLGCTKGCLVILRIRDFQKSRESLLVGLSLQLNSNALRTPSF
jgi:hypothetical protein